MARCRRCREASRLRRHDGPAAAAQLAPQGRPRSAALLEAELGILLELAQLLVQPTVFELQLLDAPRQVAHLLFKLAEADNHVGDVLGPGWKGANHAEQRRGQRRSDSGGDHPAGAFAGARTERPL